MNKVWIVEEVRRDQTSVILDVHSSLKSAQISIEEWEKCDDNARSYHTVTVMRVQSDK